MDAILAQQLDAAAAAFTNDTQALLAQMASDVERATAEPLTLFPVAHHSPASALQLVKWLNQHSPKAIYIELCEDMRGIVENLKDCKLPVALQGFAADSDFIEADQLPVMVVAPITESSAEYQAIAYALQHPEVELVFVDRATDFVFQWKTPQPKEPEDTEDEAEEVQLHGQAVGVQVGSIEPTFEEFVQFLLANSNTRHFQEWWEQYVERVLLHADYPSYLQVMTLIGSLIRNVGRKQEDVEIDRLRERYMWTRIKQHLAAHQIQPEDAIYICGAAHLASDAPEFGTHSPQIWEELPPLSQTEWLFGIIPSSFAAIEFQFSMPAGTISLAENTWRKNLKVANLQGFDIHKAHKPAKIQPVPKDAAQKFLNTPPEMAEADHEQLLDWCVRIVTMARNNGYLASTADSIAIYETMFLLAAIRHRPTPSPYDFVDAAITCLEKDRTPKKRNITHLCRILLGGDRTGTVGYASLPPLAQNIYDRLAPLGINLYAKTNQRALLDFNKSPELLDCSEVLWRLNYLIGEYVVQPIMGERKLGHKPIQESWEVRIGKYQHQVIQLGYEGVTLEQVLEQRMRARAFGEGATASMALATAEASLLFLNSRRFTRELGEHSRYLLVQETNVQDAPAIFDRARRLVYHYRTTPQGLPDWLEDFVATGYNHYSALLPQALSDQGTHPEEVAGMLGFIFSLESLALSLGCHRSQLVISVQQASHQAIPPDKLGLLWVAEWLLKIRTIEQMREFFAAQMADSLHLESLPDYLNGYLLSLSFAPRIALFVVELLSQIFGTLPDPILIPWLPTLVLQMRKHREDLHPLIREAAAVFPANVGALDTWQPHWMTDEKPITINREMTEQDKSVQEFIFALPHTLEALAAYLQV